MSKLLSLAMIFKDETNQFQRILASYGPIFDEIVIAVDEKFNEFKEIADSYPSLNIKILPYSWCRDFGHKRNFVANHVTSLMYMRLDADDAISLHCVKKVREIAENAVENDLSIVYGYYNYARDQWGNVNAAHWREVLIKRTDHLYWNKKIHENILTKNQDSFKMEMNEKLVIEHLSSEEKIHESLLRNIKYLLEEYEQDKEKTDSRTLAYLGRMLHGIGAFDKSIIFLEKHIKTSGWDEDRYMSWCQMSDCFRQKEDWEGAKAAAFEALSECPEYPDAYLRLHDVYFAQENWKKAELWGRQGLIQPIPKNFMMIDPSAYGWRPILSMAFTLFQLNKFDEALKLFNMAKRDVPGLDFITQNEKMFKTAVEHKRFMENYLAVLNFLKEKKDDKKIPELLKAAPSELDENELIIKLRQHYAKPKDWADNSVCIFALTDLEDWSPKSVVKGIGGSEEAVIYLSKELAALGLDVTVFNNCGEDAGIYEGVKYVNAINFNPKDHFNIMISWRTNIFERGIEAKKRIIWLHDIPQLALNDDGYKKIDKIVVLSKYHASLLPFNCPKEKVFISSNGINAVDFVGLENIPRETHRCIYASSYNRGLEQLLEMWPDVRKEVASATLHIYYGWDTYDTFVKQNFLKDNGFKAKMIKLMDQPGVFEHGRIGHKELLVEYAKSEILAYPCTYPGEINCIALTKAIASGCIVVSNEHQIMLERNPHCVTRDEYFKGMLISTLATLKDSRSHIGTDCKKYIKGNSWAHIANDWQENLFKFDEKVIISERLTWIRSHCEKSARIIDIGCNKGHLFCAWEKKANVTHFDIDKYDLPNFVRGDATKPLEFADKQFDIAVLGEILEHIDDPVSLIREAMRISNKLIITVPWECRWTADLMPFASIEDRMLEEKVSTRLELAKVANPATEFHTEDNFEHLYHKQFPTALTMHEWLNKADIADYSLVELRDDNWVNIGVVCG